MYVKALGIKKFKKISDSEVAKTSKQLLPNATIVAKLDTTSYYKMDSFLGCNLKHIGYYLEPLNYLLFDSTGQLISLTVNCNGDVAKGYIESNSEEPTTFIPTKRILRPSLLASIATLRLTALAPYRVFYF